MPELKIISLVLLCIVTIQDFKYRAVSWYVFPLLFCLYLADSYLSNGLNEGSFYLSVNLTIVIVQLLGVYAYYVLKNKGQRPKMSKYIGLGDVLFFVVLTAVFDPFSFIVFNVIALMAAVLWYAFQLLKTRDAMVNIPLAGIMSAVLFVTLIAGLVYKPFEINTLLL